MAFGTLAVGYALMTIAPGIWTLIPAVIVRSLGAATLWVYSTLLLQYRVENRIQGERCWRLDPRLNPCQSHFQTAGSTQRSDCRCACNAGGSPLGCLLHSHG